MTGARLTRVSAYRCALVKSGPNGSTPSRAAKNASRASPPSASSPVPKRRGSSKISSRPSSSANRTRRVARRRRRVEQQRAGHAQVQHQVDVVLELPDQVLAAPAERLDAPPRDRRGDLRARERPAPALVVDLERGQHAPLDVGREMAADRLDLGQLRHAGELDSVSRWRPGARESRIPSVRAQHPVGRLSRPAGPGSRLSLNAS